MTSEILDLVQDGDLSAIPQLFSSHYIDHTFPSGPKSGYAGVSVQVGEMHQAFSQMLVAIDELAAMSDIAVAKNHAKGIASAGPAAGQPVCTRDVTVFRLKDGKIVEHWDKLQFLPSCGN